jgi:hypothetical protein
MRRFDTRYGLARVPGARYSLFRLNLRRLYAVSVRWERKVLSINISYRLRYGFLLRVWLSNPWPSTNESIQVDWKAGMPRRRGILYSMLCRFGDRDYTGLVPIVGLPITPLCL